MKIAFGNDHGGYILREPLMNVIRERGHEIIDCGSDSSESVDYPDFAGRACREVVEGRADRAVLVCGSGIGISIAANKIKGIRCALVYDAFSAEMSRRHNNANAIAMRGRESNLEETCELLGLWLDTGFDDDERHHRRVAKIDQLEGGSC